MTLARMPDTVKEAMARMDQPITSPEGYFPGTVEVIRADGTYFWNGTAYVWKPERDVIIWNYEDPVYHTITQQPFEREATWDGTPGGDPDASGGMSAVFRDLVSGRQADVDTYNKWFRGSEIDIYRQTPEKAFDVDIGNSNRISEIKKPISSRGSRPGTKRTSGGGSTILTGGLGRYQEPETQKQKLGA